MNINTDFEASLRRARRRRNKTYEKIGIVGLVLIILIAIIVIFAKSCGNSSKTYNTPSDSEINMEHYLKSDALEIDKTEQQKEIQTLIDTYKNLGIVKVDGYLNIRKEKSTDSDIIGKLYDGSGCEIIGAQTDGWYNISSGGIEGYVTAEYIITGEAAKAAAVDLVKDRAFIDADRLNIRKEASLDSDIVDTAYKDESYEVIDQTDEWIHIKSGYISTDYCQVKKALNEARKLDLKTMVLNLYDDLGISDVDNYLNIREEPSEKGKIIGKMPSKAAGNILEKTDGWYKIQSGAVTGYVKSDYMLTGSKAKDEAIAQAQLMAVVSTDVLNVRTEPNTDAPIYTQITNAERYSVVSQSDGWVCIELEEGNDCYVSTDYVDVRYALNEAIKFSPVEEAANAAISRRSQIVNYALQFLGNPYVWGGTSLTHGADCSGFVMSVMSHFGISLPHYSGAQAKMGSSVNSASMKPGDLVFYSNSSGTINHVGMYIGNGQIVNAASRKSGIKISSWNYRTPKAIRNILGD